MQSLTYWDQLKALKLYSLERRRERYIIIYTWRILEGSTPNISEGPSGRSAYWNDRRGRYCQVPGVLTSAPCRIQNIRRASLGIKGPRLFNSLPKCLRNLTGVSIDTFKNNLDKFLKSIPDEPLIPGYTKYRSVDANSIIDWAGQTRHRTGDSAYCVHQVTNMPNGAGASMMSP